MLTTCHGHSLARRDDAKELLLHWLGATEERVVGTTGWESEEDEAFEDFVEFEEEWV